MPEAVESGNPDGGLIGAWRSNWKLISGGAAWAGAIVAALMAAPPASGPGFDPMVRLPQFLMTIGFGLLLIAAQRWGPDKHKAAWVGVCVACAAGGTLLFVEYAGLRARSTVVWEHDGRRYVTGELRSDKTGVMNQQACLATPDKAAWDDARRFIDCEHGHPEQIWTQESVSRNQTRAVMLYCGTALLYMGSIGAVLHAMKGAEVARVAAA